MKQSQFIRSSDYNAGKFRGVKPIFAKHARIITGKRFGVIPLVTAAFLDILGLANCASPDSVFNAGVPPCDLAKKKMKGVIFADRGKTFTGASIASVNAFIQAVKDATTAARGGRVYPVWDIINFEDNTGDPSTGSIGNLTTATIVTQDAIPSFRFGYNGSEARHKRMAAMSGASLDIFFVDEQFAVYGTEVAPGVFGGYSVLQAYADTSKFIVADAVNQYSFRITLGSINQYRDSSLYVVANVGLLGAVALVDVGLRYVSNATNVYKISVIADGGTNLEPLYGAALAGLTWTATNLQTGAAFVVTTVADDTSLKVLTVTFDSTAYTALASGDRIQFNGPTAAALAAVGIKPYEIIPLIITK